MTWPVVVLLVAAAGLSTAGAVAARPGAGVASEEARARRGIAGLGLMAVAIALAAIGGALLGADGTGRAQVAAFAAAAPAVAVPLLVVGLVRGARRSGRLRRARLDG